MAADPIVAIWTNLHGGFLAVIACLGLASVGILFENLPELATVLAILRPYARPASAPRS